MDPLKKKSLWIIRELKKNYSDKETFLRHSNSWELLVATVLSAQCTDARVNKVAPELFRKYRKVEDYARADLRGFEQDISSINFYRNKSKSIIAAARMVLERFDGRVPDKMEDLTTLPGVGRKTANIILFQAFGKKEGIAVDTHVRRVSRRLGLSANLVPERIEQDLLKLVPAAERGRFSLLLIQHGRKICPAARPLCEICPVSRCCDFYSKKNT